MLVKITYRPNALKYLLLQHECYCVPADRFLTHHSTYAVEGQLYVTINVKCMLNTGLLSSA